MMKAKNKTHLKDLGETYFRPVFGHDIYVSKHESQRTHHFMRVQPGLLRVWT